MDFESVVRKIEEQCKTLVWWSPEQIARGEDKVNDPRKGERAWAVPRATAEFLHDLILRHRPAVVLELGTSIGYSTVWIAHALSQYEGQPGHLHTIEIRKHKYNIARKNLENAGLLPYVTLYNASIMDVVTHLDVHLSGMKIDLLFMDADRGHYHEYFPHILPHLSEHGIVVADNAINMKLRMINFVNMLTTPSWNIHIIEKDNGILVAHRQESRHP